ncbi:LysR substrate-binding domain-containing protein [Telmatospirillum sp. J64-1]|uniref:LysR substrate-binding domain-containing protein n=1 Tax=Telmatospirillum sp. J64-1 TaxID=2502183 RepID=UPI00115ED6C0|nr:LysR substrate-binding domain-containing protein [Telmatospirillum sp. J64-1]
MRFDLTDLRLFLHIAEAGSITQGAEAAGLALASASARVRGMEETLGAPLLERGPRGVQPTPAGQALVHHARLVLLQVEQMRGELGQYAQGLKGHLRLLCNTAALTEFLPESLGAYLSRHPHIDIDLEEGLSYEIALAIAEGRGDIGIVADTVDLAGLQTFPFRVDRLVLVVPQDHAFAGRREIFFHETLAEPYIGLTPGSALQDHLVQHAIRAGTPLKLRVRLRGFEAVCRMVASGVGIAILPETAARRCRRSMPIRLLRLKDPWALRRLVLCVRRFEALPLHARKLVEHLTAEPGPPHASRRRQGGSSA